MMPSTLKHPLYLLVALSCCIAVAPVAASHIVTPTHMGEWVDGEPHGTFNGTPDAFFVNATIVALSNEHESRAFFEFDLTSAPTGVYQAELTLGPTSTNFSQCGDLIPCPLIPSFILYNYAGDGTVTTSDWGAGTPIVGISTPPDGSFLTIDVTSVVLNALTAGDPYIGFEIRPGAQGAISFGTGTVPGTTGRHELELFASRVPVPATGALLLIGLAGMIRRRGGTVRPG